MIDYAVSGLGLLEKENLVAAYSDGTSVDRRVILWNWREGNVVRALHGHKAAVTSIVELEDGLIAT